MIGNHQVRIEPEKPEKIKPEKSSGERRWLLPVIIVVVAAILLGLIGWAIYQSIRPQEKANEIVRSDACKVEHIERFNSVVNPLDLASFRELQDDVKKLDNFQGSANCMYILTRYEIAAGTADEASNNLDLLRRLAPDEHMLSGMFDGASSVRYDTLAAAIDALRKNAEQDQQMMDDITKESKAEYDATEQ